MIIRQGSIITYMQFKTCNIIFIDTLHFFNEGLRNLPAIFVIKEPVKGSCLHHFNTPANQHSTGYIQYISYFGANSMKVEDLPDFNKWYSGQADIMYRSFKDEMIKYCRDDVEVLSRGVLVFRKMFYDNLYIDTFLYIYIYIYVSLYRVFA